MLDMLEQIKAGLRQNLYYTSFFTALAVPDICGAIDSEDGLATKQKYVDWFDKYVGSEYRQVLTGQDCYFFRCSLLHQGSLQPGRGKYSRLIFIEPSVTTMVAHKNILNEALNIDIRIFCQDIINGAALWLKEVQETERFKRNFDSFVRRYPQGLRPFIGGVPVVG